MGLDGSVAVQESRWMRVGFIVLCIGLFAFPYAVRVVKVGSLAAVNFVSILGIVLFLSGGGLRYFGKGRSSFILAAEILGVCLTLFVILYSILSGDGKAGIALFASSILPLILIYSALRDLRNCLKIWCIAFSAIMGVLVICAVFNWLSDNMVSRFFSELFHSEIYAKLASEGRFVSFFGHPLSGSFTAICYAASMFAYSRVVREVNPLLYFIPSGIVVLACSSITGVVILAFLFFVQNCRTGYYKYLFFAAIVVCIFFALNLFDAVLERVSTNLSNGDITSGRNAALARLLDEEILTFELFDWRLFSSEDPGFVAATEYPPVRLSYRMGLAAAICFCLIAFVLPFIGMLKSRRWDVCGTALGLIVVVNTFDGIVSSGDICWLYSATIMFLIYAANCTPALGSTSSTHDDEIGKKRISENHALHRVPANRGRGNAAR